MTPQEKFAGRDLTTVSLGELTTAEECDYIKEELDKLTDQMKVRLVESREKIREWERSRNRHMGWHRDAMALLRATKALKVQIQVRKGEIRNQATRERNEKDERRFILAAKKVLGRETYLKIWEEAHRDEEDQS